MTSTRGIVLAGGSGTRLYPVTRSICKQLLPVYDKPMVYYPLTTLMLAGIRDILIISSPRDIPSFEELLGDGSRWGVNISFAVQEEPRGIADAFIVGADFISGRPCMMVLGDNIFFGSELPQMTRKALEENAGATVFGYPVGDPERFGIVEFDSEGRPLRIVEKPSTPRSNVAITGMYVYDRDVVDIARSLKPSQRGEIEISDLNQVYLDRGKLSVLLMGRGMAWLDTGTHESLLEAGQFVQTIEHRQGLKIACPEEVAWRMGWIDETDIERACEDLANTSYATYLQQLLLEERDGGYFRA